MTTVHNTGMPAFLRRPYAIATKRLTHTRIYPTIQITTPGSFGERARSRSARTGSCFSLPKACNMRQDYWLYAVYNCATPTPRLARVQDPFGNLLAKAKGSVLVSHAQVAEAETGGGATWPER